MIRYKRSNRVIKKCIIVVVMAGILFMVGYLYFENRLSEIIEDMSDNIIQTKAGLIISSAIIDEVEKENVTYDKLISFEKGTDGKITALKTNIIEMNKLKSNLSVKILKSLENMDTAELEVPFWTVMGAELLSGAGPTIKVSIIPVGTVKIEIDNELSSAGINQSRHQIMMKVTADITIITSVTNLTSSVSTYICIAETVIVGDVPNSYTNIDTSKK